MSTEHEHRGEDGMIPFGELDETACLDQLEQTVLNVRAVERDRLRLAQRWCELHQVDDPADGLHWLPDGTDSPIGGDGSPYVSYRAAEEYAAAVGVSTGAGQAELAVALNLRHRFPLLNARVGSLEVPLWRAKRIVEKAMLLNQDAATFVDRELARHALTCGSMLIDQAVGDAAARFDAQAQAEIEARAAASADVTIQPDTATTTGGKATGMSWLTAYGDTMVIKSFHDLICEVAAELKEAGDESDLGIRKAKAIGIIAERARAHGTNTVPGNGRGKVLYVYVTAADLHTEQTPLGTVEKLGTLTVAKIAQWFGNRFTVRPVLDLTRDDAVDPHDPPEPIRETVVLRDKTCRFPWCDKNARDCDLDHIDPYVDIDKGGGKGQTRPTNLAVLCRRHHNDKTWRGWHYQRLPDGTHLWTTPHGRRYLVDGQRTTAL